MLRIQMWAPGTSRSATNGSDTHYSGFILTRLERRVLERGQVGCVVPLWRRRGVHLDRGRTRTRACPTNLLFHLARVEARSAHLNWTPSQHDDPALNDHPPRPRDAGLLNFPAALGAVGCRRRIATRVSET
jgi:hypothetical protein